MNMQNNKKKNNYSRDSYCYECELTYEIYDVFILLYV